MKFRIVLVAILIGITSCRQSDTTNNLVFKYNETKGVPTLDPAFARSLPVIWPVNQIYNGLVQLSDSLTIQPCIAKHWSISSDGLTYSFNLRTDVYFHNSTAFNNGVGRKVVASDFVYSINRIANPQTASPGAWIFNALQGVNGSSEKVCEALNDSTLVIKLVKPFPAFIGLLSMPYAFVVPHEAVEFYGNEFRRNPVGTGPFQFKFWKEGEKLVLRRNPNYFEVDEKGNRLPYIEAVNISFIADKQSEFLEFLRGNIDFLSGVHATSKDELITRGGKLNPRYSKKITMLTGPYLNTEYLAMLYDSTLENMKNNPLKNKNFRKAIAYGFDREKLVTYLRSNLAYPAHQGFIPFGMPGFSSDLEGFNYNPTLAKEYLSAAGFPNGKGLLPISIATTDDYVDICEFIQHQLSEIGIPIKIEVLPGASYREMMANSKLPMFRASWVADYADAENYLSLFTSNNFSPSGPNYSHFSSKMVDELYSQALITESIVSREAIYRQIDSIVISEVPVIPLYYDKVVRFTQKKVSNLGVNPMNLLVLKRVRKK